MRESLALLTDLYQLTMAQGYWKTGLMEKEGVFHLFFRRRPFGGNGAIAAGLEQAVEFIRNFRFDESDLAYLRSLDLFEKEFLDSLRTFRFSVDLDAVPEGTAVMPNSPILRVCGPMMQAQLLESPLLNMINFQTLIATKAARICLAAQGDPVIEFGMRRAQGIDGAISATRASFIGGCTGTSHVLGGKLFGIPVSGTQAHSWVMAFDEEEEAFRAFGEMMPGNCVFLVDTYDSIEGTKKAIRVALEMKKKGAFVKGVRLDSGDLTKLSVEIRSLLDEAGLHEMKIMASNELDEYLISDLKEKGCKVTVWGVGTHLVTAKEQPALDGVYKLAAVRTKGGEWHYKLKISEKREKMTDPGVLQVRRFGSAQENVVDVIYDVDTKLNERPECVQVDDPSHHFTVREGLSGRDLLVPILRGGEGVYTFPTLEKVRAHSLSEQNRFPVSMRRLRQPELYPVGYEKSFYARKCQMIEEMK